MGEMELNIKQQVLVAIYVEYQKELPDMKSIKAEVFGIPREQFFVALDKLDNEGLVNDIKFVRGGDGTIPVMAITDYAKMSSYGIDYVEKKLSIEKTLSAKEKVEKVISEAGKFGLEQLKDFGARTISEMLKG
jgi:gamma-glutamylcyclotransferase (GGCT)/AIG2-like uncharacterized protein YtfP